MAGLRRFDCSLLNHGIFLPQQAVVKKMCVADVAAVQALVPMLACPGDCDGSGTVNFADLVSMLFEFGGPGSMAGCDADESGVVNFSDLVAALFLFGPCP